MALLFCEACDKFLQNSYSIFIKVITCSFPLAISPTNPTWLETKSPRSLETPEDTPLNIYNYHPPVISSQSKARKGKVMHGDATVTWHDTTERVVDVALFFDYNSAQSLLFDIF